MVWTKARYQPAKVGIAEIYGQIFWITINIIFYIVYTIHDVYVCVAP